MMGLNDEVQENQFVWASAEPLSFNHFADQLSNADDLDYGIFNPWNGQWELVNEWVHKSSTQHASIFQLQIETSDLLVKLPIWS